jgi:hypothetical protein
MDKANVACIHMQYYSAIKENKIMSFCRKMNVIRDNHGKIKTRETNEV